MKSWLKVASDTSEQIQPCQKVNFPTWIREPRSHETHEDLVSFAHYYSDLKSGSPFVTELVNLMKWGNSACLKAKYIIMKKKPTSKEEVKNISDGIKYIKSDVHPVLMKLLHEDELYFDNHMSDGNAHIRSLLYSIITIDLDESVINNLKHICEIPFIKAVSEINEEGVMNLLSRSMYGTSSLKELSVIIIRELLQNSVDACIKENKTTGKEASVWIDIRSPSVLNQNNIGDNEELCDIICRDTGVGMTWDTVKEKFFVICESGKNDDADATGGFGMAKSAIQNTPFHGWTVETNGIVTSRAGKDIHFTNENTSNPMPSNPVSLSKTHPIFKSNGTQVCLMGMAQPYFWAVHNLIEKYVISSNIKVYLNGSKIEPKFNIRDFKQLGSSMENIIDNALSDRSEEIRDSAKIEIKMKLGLNGDNDIETDNIGGFISGIKLFTYSNQKFVRIKLLSMPFKRTDTSSSVALCPIVMINGQFQYEIKNTIINLNTIIDINTNIRPSEPHYPVGSGRDSLIQEFGAPINIILEKIRNTCKVISENRTLSKGTLTTILNSSLQGLSLSNLGYNNIGDLGVSMGDILDRISNHKNTISYGQLINEIQLKGENPNTDIGSLVSMLHRQDNSRFITKEEIEELMIQAGTSTSICVEKEYLPNALVNENRGLWLNSILLWTFTLKILMRDIGPFIKKHRPDSVDLMLIPGVIISKEALGLYVPEDNEKKQPAQVLVNPIMICALLYPNCTIMATEGKSITLELLKKLEKPNTHNLSIEIFNTGIHELTHFFFPDFWGGGVTNFHLYVTSVQNRCHSSFYEIEAKSEQLLDRLTIDCIDIMNMIARHKHSGSEMNIPQIDN